MQKLVLAADAPQTKRFYKNQTVQVFIAILIGAFLGAVKPEWATAMKPLGDAFIKVIKMVIGPIIFLTIVTGIAHVGDIKKVGKIGGKAILYFEVITTIALILGMVAMNIFRPGDGFDVSSIAKGDTPSFAAAKPKGHSFSEFMMDIIPDNFVGAFSNGNLLQILFIAIMCGVSLTAMGARGKAIGESLDKYSALIFGVMALIMRMAPVGAFGAVAFTIGKYGIGSVIPLGKLLLLSIATMSFFIVCVLGAIAYYYRFNIFRFLRYLEDEILIVIGTGSSESVLPRMLEKMQQFGCSKPVVGLVLPTGYSLNLDGTSIYLSMGVLFIAQVYNVDLTLAQQLSVLGIMLLTSKGAAGVAGSAFVVLTSTIAASNVSGDIHLPIEGLALLLGIDRFMSSIRATINLIGNGVATVVIAKMEKEFDEEKALLEYRDYFEDDSIKRL